MLSNVGLSSWKSRTDGIHVSISTYEQMEPCKHQLPSTAGAVAGSFRKPLPKRKYQRSANRERSSEFKSNSCEGAVSMQS